MSSHPGGRKTPSRAVYLLRKQDPLLLTDEHGKLWGKCDLKK